MKKAIEQIAREHLNINSLKPTGHDGRDFREVGIASLKDALEAAYKAGQANACETKVTLNAPAKQVLTGKADTFEINSIELRCVSIGGAWVNGVCMGHAFSALVFREHAAKEGTELGLTRITKLTMTRINDAKPVYSWDHGQEVEPATKEAAQARATIAGDLSRRVFEGR